MQEWFNIHKSIIVISILTKKDKTHTVGGFFTVWATREAHMIISLEEKTFDKIQYPFTLKILNKVGLERPYLNIKKLYIQIYHQYHTQQWKAKSFSLRSWTRQEYQFFPLLFNIALEDLAKAIRPPKKKKKKD